jgi:hypothetical protein
MIKQIPVTNDRVTNGPIIGKFAHWCLFGPWCLVLGAFLLSGCGGPEHPDVGRVSGVVTLDGQPLAEATVMFQPTQGRASIATTDSAGKYSLTYLDGVPGALLGAHKVIIRTEIPGEDGQPPIAKEKLPKKYHEQTELTAEVKPGSNTFDFELKGQAGGAKK